MDKIVIEQQLKSLFLALLIEVATVPIVILIFRIISQKNVAGLVAGTLFITMSLALIYLSRKIKYSAALWSSIGFLIFVALPMFVVRVKNFNTPFDELTVWGMQAPLFHELSNKFFMAVVLCTVAERIYLRGRLKSLKSS